MSKRSSLASVIALVAWLGSPAMAETAGASGTEIPAPFVPNTGFFEAYVASTFNSFRRADIDRDGLDAADVERLRSKEAVEWRAKRIAEILAFDLDDDGAIGTAEVTEVLSRRGDDKPGGGQPELAVAKVMRDDIDGDGRIVFAEMLLAAKQPSPRISGMISRAATLLAADPDGDARLTAEELTGLVHEWFAVVDTDADGYISAQEAMAFHDRLPRREVERPARPVECFLPRPEDGVAVAAFGVYEGSALSSVAVAGQDQETSTIRVEIEPGTSPLYLILSSYEAMVWRIEGATSRVSRVVAVAAVGAPDGKPAVGISGIESDRVTLLTAGDCRLFFHSADKTGAAGEIC